MTVSRSTALVIGGGRGIGAACALAFARRDHDLVLVARSQEQLEATASAVRDAGAEALCIVADICEDRAVEALVRSTKTFRDRIDVLVNSAGEALLGGVDVTTPLEFDRMIQTNLVGVYRVIHHVLPMIVRPGGQVINVLSRAGRRPYENALAYGSAKCALGYLTQALAAGLASSGVRVNGISPGAVATELRRRAFPNEDQSLLPSAESVARAIAHMAGAELSGMNGAVIDFPW